MGSPDGYISNAIKELDAQRRSTERRLQALNALQAEIGSFTDQPVTELPPLRDTVTKLRNELVDLKRVTTEEQARLAELRRHQAELKEKNEQLKTGSSGYLVESGARSRPPQ